MIKKNLEKNHLPKACDQFLVCLILAIEGKMQNDRDQNLLYSPIFHSRVK